MTMHMNLLTRLVRITSPECAEKHVYNGKCKRDEVSDGDMVRVRKYGKLKTKTDLQCSSSLFSHVYIPQSYQERVCCN